MKKIINYTETVANRYLDEHLASAEVCQCEDCRLDILAIMLNILPPQYVVTEQGSIFADIKRLNFQYTTDVVVAMTKAIEMVKKQPRHEGYNIM